MTDKPGYFNPQTLKVTAFASDYNQVKASTAAWAGGLMRSCATVTTKDLKPRDVVSFKVPHEMNDVEHVGTIVDTDPHSATLSVQEHVPNEARDGWTPTGTSHVLRYSDVTQKHSTFPDLETGDRDDEDAEDDPEKVSAAVRQSFKDYFFAPTPKRR